MQLDVIHSIEGLEDVEIIRPAYAIEYDFFDPRELRFNMENRVLQNLFFAGQINGTTGYEEAAAQGLLAGINAALRAKGEEGWAPKRNESYIGVLMDDLETLGTRSLTGCSRAAPSTGCFSARTTRISASLPSPTGSA